MTSPIEGATAESPDGSTASTQSNLGEVLESNLSRAWVSIAVYQASFLETGHPEQSAGLDGWVTTFASIRQHLVTAATGARLGNQNAARNAALYQLLGDDVIAIDDLAMRGTIGAAISAIDACADISARILNVTRRNDAKRGRNRWTLSELAVTITRRTDSSGPIENWVIAANEWSSRMRIWRDALTHRECERLGPDDPRVLVICRDPSCSRFDHGAYTLPDDLGDAIADAELLISLWANAVALALPSVGGTDT
jgi:hypothetical protein